MKKAERTRRVILDKAFELIYQNGYQATSIDRLLELTHVTKGAFYYHFKNKEDMGVKMVDEVIYPEIHQTLIAPLQYSEDPLSDIFNVIMNVFRTADYQKITYGCPASNMIQEMAPLSENFNEALKRMLDRWQGTIVEALDRGKQSGKVRKDVDSQSVAEFIVVSYEGLRSLGKVYQSKAYYKNFLKQLRVYLDSLK